MINYSILLSLAGKPRFEMRVNDDLRPSSLLLIGPVEIPGNEKKTRGVIYAKKKIVSNFIVALAINDTKIYNNNLYNY